jgi:putative transposase
MSRNTSFVPGEFYHIYNRGVEGRIIYTDEHDYSRAKLLLYLANSERRIDIDDSLKKVQTFLDLWNIDGEKKRVEIGAWCLMPNHYHILIRAVDEAGVGKFMKAFATAYSMYFNARHERCGALMQGAYKSKCVTRDTQLQYLLSYIHLNPVKLVPGEKDWKQRGIQDAKRVREFLDDFPNSSYLDYVTPNSRHESTILDTAVFPWKADSLQTMSEEALAWLESN